MESPEEKTNSLTLHQSKQIKEKRMEFRNINKIQNPNMHIYPGMILTNALF